MRRQPLANAALGPGECANIAAGYSTVLSDFIAEAAAGTPNPGWDFEPDTLQHQGRNHGERSPTRAAKPHTFTEVGAVRRGLRPAGRRAGTSTAVPECAGRVFQGCGGQDPAPARQRSSMMTGLSKGDTPLSMLPPSLDAHGRGSKVTHEEDGPPLTPHLRGRHIRRGFRRMGTTNAGPALD